MKHWFSSITCIAVLAAGPAVAAAADWNPAAVGHELSNGQAVQALEATNARLADQPDDPQAQFLQAMALARTGDASHAIDLYRKLSTEYPQRARVWNNLGVLYARQGRLDKARDALAHAVAAAPDYAVADENLGDVYVALASAAYRHAQQQGASAEAMTRRRRALARLVPALPSPAQPTAVSAKPSAATPADAAAASGSSHGAAKNPASGPPRQAIDQVLSHWANAWSQQDVSAYLAAYSDDYQPQGKISRAQWIRQQRARVTQPKSVHVSVSDVRVTAQSSNRAQATFQEHYRAAGNERDATRHMVFVREDGAWRIRQES
ncbi:tetratricopeptide repeat protein [Salinisphaera sp. LB1]|uniref:L,D-transpeptidase Cds6 family protein n=1 Tax=Salinisphaera sp. LB1 TaxID=2183911 RepID=UPI000D708A14|nr:tetratricopeptide repeat protein [Salinisphaera sp. LB1]AWN17458.1 TPR repeat precursor [Salinisphaera sp. LB1]